MNFGPSLLKILFSVIIGWFGSFVTLRYAIVAGVLPGGGHNPFDIFVPQLIFIIVIYTIWSFFQRKHD